MNRRINSEVIRNVMLWRRRFDRVDPALKSFGERVMLFAHNLSSLRLILLCIFKRERNAIKRKRRGRSDSTYSSLCMIIRSRATAHASASRSSGRIRKRARRAPCRSTGSKLANSRKLGSCFNHWARLGQIPLRRSTGRVRRQSSAHTAASSKEPVRKGPARPLGADDDARGRSLRADEREFAWRGSIRKETFAYA